MIRNLGKNEILMEFFSGKNSLTSSKLERIDIFSMNGALRIDLHFELSTSDRVRLNFSGIEEYLFYHSSDYIFYNVEILKFFKVDDRVYISLDPADEDESISHDDKDYILCDSVEGFIVK